MKIKFTLLCVVLLLVSTIVFMTSYNKSNSTLKSQMNNEESFLEEEEGEDELPKETRMDKAMEQEFEMTRDLASNSIPKEKLLEAKRYIEHLQTSVEDRSSVPLIWEERGPDNVAGRTRSVLMDLNDPTGNTVFTGSVGGGLWKTTNIQNEDPNWVAIDDFFDNIAISSIAQDPSNPDIIYFGTGEGFYNADAIRGLGVWKSTDGGDTWTQLPTTNNSSFRYVQKLVVNNQGDLFAATRSGLYKSFDKGETWDLKLSEEEGGAITDRAADIEIASNGDIYVTMGLNSTDGIYKSSNNGSSWDKLTNGVPVEGFERIEIACAPSNANRVYALFQNSGDNKCGRILRTDDGGNSWTSLPVPDAIGMDNFARNQAWYDLFVGVDPNNDDRVFIGGVDIHVSDNAGGNWTQISQWYGGAGMQYVHADQHTLIFKPGSSDIALFGNDGGIWYTENASSFIPTISDRNTGYNVTQYYACAIHPDAGSNLFLAGAQDNGTQRYDDPGMNSTVRVTGGDGMFCHIDQLNGNVQITSYVYNNYRISLNGGNNFDNRNYDDSGRFVNPTDYDSQAKKLYGATHARRYLRWNDPAQGGFSFEEVEVEAFANGQVSHVLASPNIDNRVYFGLGNGNIVRVDDAHTDTMKVGAVIRDGDGYVSCIDVELGNEEHMIMSYSNYGQVSIYETTDGGSNWTSIEGDLPDMPVRWAMFVPNNPDQVLIATELGVWTTTDLNGENTKWEPSNSSLANVRVDMLQVRASDHTVIAATHGRGLFSTDYFSRLAVDFEDTETTVSENGADGNSPDCRGYEEFEIPIVISRNPETNISFDVSVNANSTAIESKDFDFVTNTVSFLPAGSLKSNITIRVYDDAIVEQEEEIVLDLVAVDNQGLNFQHIIKVRDNDKDPKAGEPSEEGTIGTANSNQAKGPYGGFAADSKTQILYTAEELTAQGLSRGAIVSAGFNVVNKVSNQPYSGFTIAMKLTDSESLTAPTFEEDLKTVFTGDVSTVFGWNIHEFSTPFVWDGSSNVLVSICFDNETWTLDDRVAASPTDSITLTTNRSYDDVGCNLTAVKNSYDLRPDIRFELERDVVIETNLGTTAEAYVQPGETTHFYSEAGNIIASIKQLTGTNNEIACVSIELDRAGVGQDMPSWLNGFAVSEKTIYVTADNDEEYEITLYYTEEELAIWGTEKTALHILKTSVPVSGASLAEASLRDNAGLNVSEYGATNNICYKGTFKHFSGFALTNAEGVITSTEEQDLENNSNSFSFYPNPAKSYILVDFATNLTGNNRLKLVDITGKQLSSIVLERGNTSQVKIDLQTLNLSSGIYFLRLEGESGLQQVKRLVIAN